MSWKVQVIETDVTGNFFSNKLTYVLAALLLLTFLGFQWQAMRGESHVIDELAHITAGYSYVKFLDYRLNPEHPPLVKILAGLPLLFRSYDFPLNSFSWQNGLNEQWKLGEIFFYQSGNNIDELVFLSRLGPLFLTLLFFLVVFLVVKRNYGNTVALLVLFFLTFSPTFLAHGHLVTTDVAAAFGFFVGFWTFWNYLKIPRLDNLILAGLGLGFALLAKYSTLLLLPFLAVMLLAWAWVEATATSFGFWRRLFKYSAGFVAVLAIAGGLVMVVYAVLIQGYPLERQYLDIRANLTRYVGARHSWFANWYLQNLAVGPLRSMGQYLLGIIMVMARATEISHTYFFGRIQGEGNPWYFPFLYAVKEPLALHVLTALALVVYLFNSARLAVASRLKNFWRWAYEHFAELAMLGLVAFYWVYAMMSNLNIGIRHMLPTLPFIYILVALGVWRWLEWVSQNFKRPRLKTAIVILLLTWQALSVASQAPYFLPYANALVGGPQNLHTYVVDSNVDWGQDLKRLVQYVEDNHIEKIRVAYFGSAVAPGYYLKDKLVPWPEDGSTSNLHGYIAISATYLMSGWFGMAVDGPRYDFFSQYQPKAVVGNSIFVYDLP